LTPNNFFVRKKRYKPKFRLGKARLTDDELDFLYVQKALDLETKRRGGREYIV